MGAAVLQAALADIDLARGCYLSAVQCLSYRVSLVGEAPYPQSPAVYRSVHMACAVQDVAFVCSFTALDKGDGAGVGQRALADIALAMWLSIFCGWPVLSYPCQLSIQFARMCALRSMHISCTLCRVLHWNCVDVHMHIARVWVQLASV